MSIASVRRLAADLFGIGENKIRISPDHLGEAEGALTREDVRGLIQKGIVTKAKPQGRASTNKDKARGMAHRRGNRIPSKVAWMEKVRSQRRFLKDLLAGGVLKRADKWNVYMKIKSGMFKSKRAMLLYLKDNRLVPAEFEIMKAKPGGLPKEATKKAPSEKQVQAPAQKDRPQHPEQKSGAAPSGTAVPAKDNQRAPEAQRPAQHKRGESR